MEYSIKIDIPVESLKFQWGKIKENYRKCLKKREIKQRSGAGSDKLPLCSFFTELSFLNDSLLNKRSESNIFTTEDDKSNTPVIKKKKNDENVENYPLLMRQF